MEFSKNKEENELSCNIGPFHFFIFLYDDCANVVWHYDCRHGDIVLLDEQTAIEWCKNLAIKQTEDLYRRLTALSPTYGSEIKAQLRDAGEENVTGELFGERPGR